MKKYIRLLIESQDCFRFSSKKQIFKLLAGNILVGLCETLGFVPLFWLVVVMSDPVAILNYRWIGSVFQHFSVVNPLEILLILSAMVAVLFVAKTGLQILYHQRISKVTALWGNKISQEVFFNYFKAHYAVLLKRNLPYMRTMIGYGHTIPNEFFLHVVFLLSYSLQIFFLLLVILVTLRSVILLVLVVALIAFILDRFYIRQKLIKIQEALLRRTIARSLIEENSINNIKEAKLSGQEETYIKQYDKIILPDSVDKARLSFLGFLPSQITEVLAIIGLIVIFNALASFSTNNNLLTAQIGIMVGVVFRFLPYLNRIMHSWNHLKSFSTIMRKLLDEYKEVRAARGVEIENSLPIDFKQSINFHQVAYRYNDKEKYVVDNVNLVIKKGEFIGLTGPSGSGKTTLANLLMGFIAPSKGHIMVDDTILRPEHIHHWYKKIGMVDQDIYIAVGTVAENVAYGESLAEIKTSKAKQAQIVGALKKAQIWDFVKSLPQGIFTKIGEGEKLLSGGQGQRIAIARAFYRHIEILVLDEASAKLDMATERSFFDYLQTLKGQLTVVMIAHRLSTLKSCDKILFIKEGEIKSSGNFSELEKSNEDFRSYLLQAKV